MNRFKCEVSKVMQRSELLFLIIEALGCQLKINNENVDN